MVQHRRLRFQAILESILGSRNVYFQPPNNVTMKYPAIIYEHDRNDVTRADNGIYGLRKRYQVTYIDQDPDSSIPDVLAHLPYSNFDRHFVADHLNHSVLNIHY